ncbi:MAG: redox-active disulfide protein 2 [Bacteroidota bacterium]
MMNNLKKYPNTSKNDLQMKNTDLKSKTKEALEADLKTIKSVTGVLIGVLLVLFAVTLYGVFTKENKTPFIALIAVGVSCGAIVPLQFVQMKKIKAELNVRKEIQ